MDVGLLLAARLGLAPFSAVADTPPAGPEPLAPPETPPSAAWIRGAVDAVARHQRSGHAERAWPLLRVIEPLVPGLGERDPGSAGRVIGVLATQALVEGDCEAFLERARRAAEVFDRAGDAAAAAVERASLGAGYRMLGAWDEAERALGQAIAAAATDGGVAAGARLDRARVLAARGSEAEARALAAEAAGIFAQRGDGGGEGAARAWLAGRATPEGGAAAALVEAQRAGELLAGSPAGRALAGAARARALLAAGRVEEALAAAEHACGEMEAAGRLDEGELGVRLALGDARRAAGDEAGAAVAFGEARRRVLADAAKLRDPALRRSFLEGIPDHRRALG